MTAIKKTKKKFSATSKARVQNGKYYFGWKRREMAKNIDERGIRNEMMVKLHWKILEYNTVILEEWKIILEASKLDEGRTWFGKTRKLDYSFFGSGTRRLRKMEWEEWKTWIDYRGIDVCKNPEGYTLGWPKFDLHFLILLPHWGSYVFVKNFFLRY